MARPFRRVECVYSAIRRIEREKCPSATLCFARCGFRERRKQPGVYSVANNEPLTMAAMIPLASLCVFVRALRHSARIRQLINRAPAQSGERNPPVKYLSRATWPRGSFPCRY